MHNLSDRRLVSRNKRLELDDLCLADKETGKPKVICYRADQQGILRLFQGIKIQKFSQEKLAS